MNIDTVVFDLGNVLVSFQPKKEMEALYGPQKAKEMYTLFFPDLWNAYDQGILDKEMMVEKAATQNQDLHEQIADWMERWTDYLLPYPENVRLVLRLKERGFKTYVLSNINEDALQALKARGLFDLFDGGIYSCKEKLIKPDQKIYEKLLDVYDLKAERCLFIDDSQANIQAAKKAGMQALHLDGIEKLHTLLKERLL
jgi:putative hydrolase of the HAD superfamily